MEPTEPRQIYQKKQEVFRKTAMKIINKMVDWWKKTPGSKYLVDEVLHSIFFLGGMNKLNFEPKDIVGDEMLSELKEQYPRPFQYYRSQLPKRSPFSCVLDMIVLKEGQSQQEKIKKCLKEFADELKPSSLVSSTMCVTTCKKFNSNYYGVSMSTEKGKPRKIMIAASCLSFWDEYVAGAVMTYYPEKPKSDQYTKKSYFDGTIRLPEDMVTCQAYSLKKNLNPNVPEDTEENMVPMDPCKSCGNLFGLPANNQNDYPCGNCAEVESVSKLLKIESDVKDAAKPTSPTYTDENKEKAKDSVRNVLRQLLREVDFKWEFYEPQAHISYCDKCKRCCCCSRCCHEVPQF